MQAVQGNRPKIRATIASTWWIVLARGIVGVLLGAALFSQTELSDDVLAEFLALYWLADAAFMLIATFVLLRVAGKWWRWMLLRSIIGIVAAFVVLAAVEANEALTDAMIIVLAVQAIIAGIIDLITNFGLRSEAPDEWAMAISATMQVVLGILLIVSPLATLPLIGPIVGFVAFLGGIAMIVYSFRMRKL